ncbi:MAG: amidohydrolase [Saprospiraceae bacterium]|nr:amidohydrolase [Saprospiraceae bacterium]MCB9321509.1 amidohydrolase [Lewinellaceae bacterium]
MWKAWLLGIGMAFSWTGTTPVNPEIIRDMIQDDLPYLSEFYKDLHLHPEISLQEEKTSHKLAETMRGLGFEVTENVGGYGIVALLRNGDGPQILYRTDMDALPMYEKTELPYASSVEIVKDGTTVGTMHSCGHDMHMTTWLGVARTMIKLKNQWRGTLMMIGEPAEEIGQGSKLMLDAGLYDRFGVPDYGIGIHCNPTLPAGQMGYGKGYTMANTESIDIHISGVGAHGASPHMSIDPVVIAAEMVMELQTIVSRSVPPTESAVVTVGAIKGGTVHNIIPDEVTLLLTVRTFKEEVRQLVHRRIKEIARGVAISAGLPEDKMPVVTIPDVFTPANFNNPDLVDKLRISAVKTIGSDLVAETEPLTIGEDFSRYGQTADQVPTVLCWLGTVPDERLDQSDLPGLHSPYYYPAIEKSLITGIGVTVQSLLDLMPAH